MLRDGSKITRHRWRRAVAFLLYLPTLWFALHFLVRGLGKGGWDGLVLAGWALFIFYIGAGTAVRVGKVPPNRFFSALYRSLFGHPTEE